MRHIVDAIAAQGRNGDDTLIHVSKKELRMLKNIGDQIGIKSTTNPKTGLPEAFNWLGTIGGIGGGILGTVIAPGAGTAAGAALGSGLGTAAGGGTLKQSLTTGLISGVTAYAGGAALGSMAEAGAALPADAVAPAVTDTVAPAVTDTVAPAVTDTVAPAVTDTTAQTGSGLAGNTPDNGGMLNNTDVPPNTQPDTSGVKSLDTTSSANPPTTEPTPVEPTPAEPSGLAGNNPNNGGALNNTDVPPTPSTPTKPDFKFSDVGRYMENTPTKDIVKQYGADLAKTAVGQGMVGMMPVGSPAAVEPIAIPGKKEMAKPKVEFYQGPEGELRTRAVPAMAQGGIASFADYDGVEDAAAGGIMGYAAGGSTSSASASQSGAKSPVNSIYRGSAFDTYAEDVNTPATRGNRAIKTGPVLPENFFSREDYLRATPDQRAEMDRLMAAQREMVPSPMRKQFAEGGIASFSGGGIGFVRSMQPGGQWGDMTADMYGAVQEQKPQWLQNIEPGGFVGATVPGKMDYEDKKRAEEDAKKAEEKAKVDAAAAQLKLQEEDRINKIRGGSMLQPTSTNAMAAGGIASFAKGRYLQGPGDGMSDSIPADIDGKQPARLATGEFVVPADVVSGLGNGDSTAGAKQLHAMMDRTRQARTGTKKQGKQINPRKMMPA